MPNAGELSLMWQTLSSIKISVGEIIPPTDFNLWCGREAFKGGKDPPLYPCGLTMVMYIGDLWVVTLDGKGNLFLMATSRKNNAGGDVAANILPCPTSGNMMNVSHLCVRRECWK